jgi:Ca2+-binding RTX toxin-like protein
MEGGAGDDTYWVDSAGDVASEAAGGGGNDRVFTTVSHALDNLSEVEVLGTAASAGTTAIDLTGSAYANRLIGNDGDNVLNGAFGRDTLTGGAGQDAFCFTNSLNPSLNVDDIVDFSVTDDTIRLENAVFTSLGAGILASGAFRIGATAQDYNDHVIYNDATGALSYDADGNGAGAAIQFAQLAAGLALTSLDFLVV